MLTLEDVGLTEKDIESSKWNTFEELDSEEEISGFIQATRINIEEGDCEPGFIFQALTIAATARSINQIAKQSGIDRKELCGLFAQNNGNANACNLNTKIVAKITEAFLAPQPA
jgi:probable addiction module antidote protein